MNVYPSYRSTADAPAGHIYDTVAAYGLLAGGMLAAEDRLRKCVRAPSAAAQARTPSAWRCRLGALLVRTGGRLQGVSMASLAPDAAKAATG